MISQKTIEETVVKLFKKAVTTLPEDVVSALKRAYENENNKIARYNLKAILENIEIARRKKTPICQDTGLPIVYVKLGNVEVENLYESIRNGVKKATKEIPLRPNVVNPFTRKNTGTNVGYRIPEIELELIDEDYLEITVLPKGFGSENNSALKMLSPNEQDKIKDFVLETVISANGKPCPPIIVGVGIGGSADYAMKLAKKSLLRRIGEKHEDNVVKKMEEELLNIINKTGIGPMGLGGNTTALDVKIEYADTHTAGLPVGVCIQCWAARHATAIID